MGGVTVTAPDGTRLKPRSVNFVRTGIFLENPERFALNVVGIGEWCSRNGTAVQGFEYDANDGTVIVQVDNRSNEWVNMGEQDEAFRFIFSKRITRLRPRVRWAADIKVQPTRKGRSQRVTRISRGDLAMDSGCRGTTEGGMGDGAGQSDGLFKTEGEPFVCRTLFQGGIAPNGETGGGQEIIDSGEEPDTEYESDAEGMLKPRGGADREIRPPRLCRRRRCRECRSHPRGNASIPYLALATATLCNMCFIQKHPTFADKLVRFVAEDAEFADEEETRSRR